VLLVITAGMLCFGLDLGLKAKVFGLGLGLEVHGLDLGLGLE